MSKLRLIAFLSVVAAPAAAAAQYPDPHVNGAPGRISAIREAYARDRANQANEREMSSSERMEHDSLLFFIAAIFVIGIGILVKMRDAGQKPLNGDGESAEGSPRE
jgi:hypothetical protein